MMGKIREILMPDGHGTTNRMPGLFGCNHGFGIRCFFVDSFSHSRSTQWYYIKVFASEIIHPGCLVVVNPICLLHVADVVAVLSQSPVDKSKKFFPPLGRPIPCPSPSTVVVVYIVGKTVSQFFGHFGPSDYCLTIIRYPH